jgi:hypothetical protein
MRKNIAGVAGLLLLLGFITSSGWSELADWSTAEKVGGNVWHLLSLGGGGWLIYYALTNREGK